MAGGEAQQPPCYRVVITSTAESMLRDIKRTRGKQTYEQLREVIRELLENPWQRTKPLAGLLKEFRSLHSGRFRIIVKIDDGVLHVYVVGVGWHTSGDRDDVYQILARLVEQGRVVLPK